jgi:hypothetical protein
MHSKAVSATAVIATEVAEEQREVTNDSLGAVESFAAVLRSR